MTTIPIDNNLLTQGSLKFIGINANKLTFLSINIIHSSNKYSIVYGFICRNQNMLHMKILDTFLRVTKRRFRFWELKISITKVK